MTDINLLKKGEKNALKVKPLSEIISLKGQTAIVTGGAGGLGYAVTNRLAEAGANVVIVDLDEERGSNAAEEFKKRGFSVSFFQADITKVENCDAAVKFAEDTYGQLDILVNNAAMWIMKSLVDNTEEDFDKVFNLNIKATYFMIKAAARSMIMHRRPGKIVNVSSNAYRGFDSSMVGLLTTYNASKAAVVGLTKGAAKELKQYGINVNCIAPGNMDTYGNMVEQKGLMPYFAKYDPQVLGAHLMSNQATLPYCNPDEVALMIFSACTPMADFVYGEVIEVSGGAGYAFQPMPLALTLDIPEDYTCPRVLNTGREDYDKIDGASIGK